jgi:hypothetical protein
MVEFCQVIKVENVLEISKAQGEATSGAHTERHRNWNVERTVRKTIE